jgi:hypothetical protein
VRCFGYTTRCKRKYEMGRHVSVLARVVVFRLEETQIRYALQSANYIHWCCARIQEVSSVKALSVICDPLRKPLIYSMSTHQYSAQKFRTSRAESNPAARLNHSFRFDLLSREIYPTMINSHCVILILMSRD